MTTLLGKWAQGKSILVNTLEPEIDDDGIFTGFYTGSGGGGREETVDATYNAYVSSVYKRNGIVFACIAARMLPFSEVRFQLQDIVEGRPGKLRDDPSLSILERPWANATTGELLSRMEQDASLAGNFYATTAGTGPGRRIRRLRPNWVTIISGVADTPEGSSPWDIEAEPLLYIYDPPDGQTVALTPDRVVHYSPIPDPDYQWRGMSWLTPVIREVQADYMATTHKLRWFENGAALSFAIKYDPTLDPTKFAEYVELFEKNHRGTDKAYKTLHIGGGADATVLGTELKLDFKAIQGAGETRIAAAAGVGSIIGRFSEGMQGSALNEGNYASAVRQFADMTVRPLWRTAAGALAKLVDIPDPAKSRLWYDPRDVEFLKDDRKDGAEILAKTAETINSLVAAGYTPTSVIDAVETGDLALLEHSGLYSVQLQKVGERQELTPPQNTPPVPEDLTPAQAKAWLELALKVGARNSAHDQGHIQTAHDELVSAGATCSTEDQ